MGYLCVRRHNLMNDGTSQATSAMNDDLASANAAASAAIAIAPSVMTTPVTEMAIDPVAERMKSKLFTLLWDTLSSVLLRDLIRLIALYTCNLRNVTFC